MTNLSAVAAVFFPQVNLLADDGELLLADLEAVSGWLRVHRNQTSLIPGVR